MKISEIIGRQRNKLRDIVSNSYLWSDTELVDYNNEIQDRLCELLFLIYDSTKDISITGSSDITFTATTKKISRTSGGFLSAGFYEGNKITISGTSSNNGIKTITSVIDTEIVVSESLVNESNTNAVISATTTMTQIPVTTGTHTYSVDGKIIRIERARLSSQTDPLEILREGAVGFMDDNYSGWESASNNKPKILITDEIGTNKIRLYPPPNANDTLYLSVYRYPIYQLSLTSDNSPEIPTKYHRRLDNGVYSLAFGKEDAQTIDSAAESKFYQRFLLDIEEIKRDRIKTGYIERINPPLIGNL